MEIKFLGKNKTQNFDNSQNYEKGQAMDFYKERK
jgi:hypothetical protein